MGRAKEKGVCGRAAKPPAAKPPVAKKSEKRVIAEVKETATEVTTPRQPVLPLRPIAPKTEVEMVEYDDMPEYDLGVSIRTAFENENLDPLPNTARSGEQAAWER